MKQLGQSGHVCAYRLKSGRFVGLDQPGAASYDDLLPDDYWLYFRIPLDELHFDNHSEAFDYLLKESNGSAWYAVGKQPLRYGDILTVETFCFMLKPVGFCTDRYIALPAWPDVGLDPYIVRRT